MNKRKREEAELEAQINPKELARKMRGEQTIADIAFSDDEEDGDFEPEGGKGGNDDVQPQLVRLPTLRPSGPTRARGETRSFSAPRGSRSCTARGSVLNFAQFNGVENAIFASGPGAMAPLRQHRRRFRRGGHQPPVRQGAATEPAAAPL